MTSTAKTPARSSRMGHESEELGAALDIRDLAWEALIAKRRELEAAERTYNRATFNASIIKNNLVEGACYRFDERIGILQFRNDALSTLQLRLFTKAGKPGTVFIVRYPDSLKLADVPEEAKAAALQIEADEHKALFSKFAGAAPLLETTVEDIPSRELYEYWASKGASHKWDSMTPDDRVQVLSHWRSVQQGLGIS